MREHADNDQLVSSLMASLYLPPSWGTDSCKSVARVPSETGGAVDSKSPYQPLKALMSNPEGAHLHPRAQSGVATLKAGGTVGRQSHNLKDCHLLANTTLVGFTLTLLEWAHMCLPSGSNRAAAITRSQDTATWGFALPGAQGHAWQEPDSVEEDMGGWMDQKTAKKINRKYFPVCFRYKCCCCCAKNN